MRVGGPYVEDFDITNWGCLEQETKLHPLVPVQSRKSRTIDRLRGRISLQRKQKVLLSHDVAQPGLSNASATVTSPGQYVLITGGERTLLGGSEPI
jgi:hypothetical protein